MRRISRPRLATAVLAVGAAVLIGVGGAAGTSGTAGADEHGAGASTPQHASGIPNLGLVKNKIEAYYGDDGDHQPSPRSHYARDARHVERGLSRWLHHNHARHGSKPAVVFDVDDTVLNSYTYEASHDFGYDADSNAACVKAKCFPAVYGMVDVVTWATQHHIAVFYLTGRPADQQADTVANLRDEGFPAPTGIFTKPTAAPYPPYLKCMPDCSTIEYKSGTRAHIESMGYTIVANAGDQYSDLKGGHAMRTFKMPNPMYYLP